MLACKLNRGRYLTDMSAIHKLCHDIGCSISYWCHPVSYGDIRNSVHDELSRWYEDFSSNVRLQFADLFTKRTEDACTCACSNHGCVPATTLLKQIHFPRENGRGRDQEAETEVRVQVLDWMMNIIGSEPENWTWLAPEAIRFETFRRLELSHTCCDCEYKGWFVRRHSEAGHAGTAREATYRVQREVHRAWSVPAGIPERPLERED